jgi:hypothetical protein
MKLPKIIYKIFSFISYEMDKAYLESLDPITRLYEAKRLYPKDHIFVKEATSCQQKEYGPAQKQEDAFYHKYVLYSETHFDSIKDIAAIANELCDVMNYPHLRGVELVDVKRYPYYGAYYLTVSQKIYVRLPCSIDIICHEVSHHIAGRNNLGTAQGGSHGERFLEVEALLFEYLLKKVRAKKKRPI